MKNAAKWYIYIVECSDGTLYTGITNDLERRINEHNTDDNKAARYTKIRRPVNLVFTEECSGRGNATKREKEIKKLSREKKLKLLSKKNV